MLSDYMCAHLGHRCHIIRCVLIGIILIIHCIFIVVIRALYNTMELRMCLAEGLLYCVI